MSHITSSRAFTLTETLIVVGILGLISGAVVTMFLNYSSVYQRENSGVSVTQSASRTITLISTTIAQSSGVIASRTINGVAYVTSSTTLIVQLPAASTNGDIIQGGFDYTVFHASGTVMTESTETYSGSYRSPGTYTLTTSLSNVTFTYDNPIASLVENIGVLVHTKATTRTGVKETHVYRETHMRNK